MSKTVPAGACWLFRAITFQRLRVLECKRPCLKLDILSFIGTFESFNLDKNWRRYSLGKRRVLHSQNCRVNAIFVSFHLFLVLFVFLVIMDECVVCFMSFMIC
uniref:Uncharacterized protein n=1 Tax=Opuntia streptacantha TaxID=393608 RepID=A0A7C9ASG7_OPUST